MLGSSQSHEPESLPPATARIIGPSGQEWVFGGDDLTVGRAHDNGVRLTDPTVSRYHLRFMYSDGVPLVVDLNSSNGTYINGVAISGVHALRDGDIVEAGDAKLVFRAPAPPHEPQAEPPPEADAGPLEVAPQPATDLDRDSVMAEPSLSVAPPPTEPVVETPHVSPAVAPVAPPQHELSTGVEGDLVTRHQILSTTRGVVVAELQPVGALSIESADQFRAQCDELLAAGHTRFLFDLGNVEYLDSTGLAVLLRLSREARSRGGQVWFFDETPAVRSIFELTNLRKVLHIVPERAVALAETEELRP